jgi:hypothetical protein
VECWDIYWIIIKYFLNFNQGGIVVTYLSVDVDFVLDSLCFLISGIFVLCLFREGMFRKEVESDKIETIENEKELENQTDLKSEMELENQKINENNEKINENEVIMNINNDKININEENNDKKEVIENENFNEEIEINENNEIEEKELNENLLEEKINDPIQEPEKKSKNFFSMFFETIKYFYHNPDTFQITLAGFF